MGVPGTLCIVASLCAAFLRRPVRTLGLGLPTGRTRLQFATCDFFRGGKRRLAGLSGTGAGGGILDAARGTTSGQGRRSFGLSSGFFLCVRLVSGRPGPVSLIVALLLAFLVMLRFCLRLVSF